MSEEIQPSTTSQHKPAYTVNVKPSGKPQQRSPIEDSLWPILRSSTAEAAQAPWGDIQQFQSSCVYFATIYAERQSSHSFLLEPEAQKQANEIYWREFLGEPDNDSSLPSRRVDRSLLSLESGHLSVTYPLDSLVRHTGRWPVRRNRYGFNDSINSIIHESRGFPVGIVYLKPSGPLHGPSSVGEVNLGLALTPNFQGQGIGAQAVLLILKLAFDELNLHRVQVAIVDGPCKEYAQILFTTLGFVYEGKRRRAIQTPDDQTWKDVTHLGMLDTDWFINHLFRPAPTAMWNKLLIRQQRELEQLLKWESKQTPRKNSMDTIRQTKKAIVNVDMCDGDLFTSQDRDKGKISESPLIDRGEGLPTNLTEASLSASRINSDTKEWELSDSEISDFIKVSKKRSIHIMDSGDSDADYPPDTESDAGSEASWFT